MKEENKDIKEEVDKFRKTKEDNKHENELLQFFLGMVLLAVGLFMLSKRVLVTSSWYTWRLGGISLSSGTVTIPLIIGIIWYFFNQKSIGAKIVITISAILIVVSIIMSLRITFIATSFFDYLLIIGIAGAGAGLLLKTLFKKRND